MEFSQGSNGIKNLHLNSNNKETSSPFVEFYEIKYKTNRLVYVGQTKKEKGTEKENRDGYGTLYLPELKIKN